MLGILPFNFTKRSKVLHSLTDSYDHDGCQY